MMVQSPVIDYSFKKEVEQIRLSIEAVKREMARFIVGQQRVIESFLEAIISNGHVLVEGLPGLAKTLVVKTLASICGVEFSRIQFTPDLLPSDIIGVTTYDEKKGFYVLKGPIFANFVLADEINRAPPKVQSALLEAMQERQVTIGRETYKLPEPFFVMATQNPLETLGTYKLPEAELDRFLYKILITYPSFDEEIEILEKNDVMIDFKKNKPRQILSAESIKRMQQLVKKVHTSKKVENYIIKVVDATRYPKKYNIELGKYIEYGASPRSSIALFLTSKARALIKGRTYVTQKDVREVAFNILRHRIILNYEGQAEGITPDQFIAEILKKIPLL